MQDDPRDLAFCSHDHWRCIAQVLHHAEAVCAERNLRFTKLRRRVLEILLESHMALGAYDVLARLQAEGLGAQPPVAYRALDFLVAHGLAHKIEGIAAFIACTHADAEHSPAFLICRNCRAVAETHPDPAEAAIGEAAAAVGFTVESTLIEAQGLCPACQEQTEA